MSTKRFRLDPDNISRVELDGVTELYDLGTATAPNNSVNAPLVKELLGPTHSSWTNNCSLGILKSYLDNGPQHILMYVDKIKERIQDKIAMPVKQRRKRRGHMEQGDELDPVAWIQRDPEGWTDSVKIRVPKNNIRIGVNLATPGDCRAEALLFRGAVVAALADLLSQQGNNVEVVAFEIGTNLGQHRLFTMTTMIKAMEAPVNLSAMCTAIAEIGFYRLVVLPAQVVVSDTKVSDGVSGCADIPLADRASMDIIVEWDRMNEEAATQYVLRQLEKFSKHLQGG